MSGARITLPDGQEFVVGSPVHVVGTGQRVFAGVLSGLTCTAHRLNAIVCLEPNCSLQLEGSLNPEGTYQDSRLVTPLVVTHLDCDLTPTQFCPAPGMDCVRCRASGVRLLAPIEVQGHVEPGGVICFQVCEGRVVPDDLGSLSVAVRNPDGGEATVGFVRFPDTTFTIQPSPFERSETRQEFKYPTWAMTTPLDVKPDASAPLDVKPDASAPVDVKPDASAPDA